MGEYEITLCCPGCGREFVEEMDERKGFHTTFCTWCGKKCRYKV
jgi:hypothetical protein